MVPSAAAITVELLGHKVVQLLRCQLLVVVRCLPVFMVNLLLQCRDESWVEHLLVVVLQLLVELRLLLLQVLQGDGRVWACRFRRLLRRWSLVDAARVLLLLSS